MKIVLDLQGTQSNSRYRGIGRYSLSMAKAFAVEAGHHELWLALNGRADKSSTELIEQFSDLIPRERIVTNELPAQIAGCIPGNRWRGELAASAQSSFLAGLKADCIWHSSLFEGWGDDSTAALGGGLSDHRHVSTLYDLIPLLNPSRHLRDAEYDRWYHQRLGLLKRCGLLLAISASSRREAIEELQIPEGRVAVVYGAADAVFRSTPADALTWARWQRDWQLKPGFLLYAGGYDTHKNVDTLLAAFAQLPPALRDQHPLVLAGRCDAATERHLRDVARKHRLATSSLVFTGVLTDGELARLYSSCLLFVAPSLHEGLGLPPLEAMACGAAVIGSNTASLPEVIGRPDALFDPLSRSSIADKLLHVLGDPDFLESLRRHALVQSQRFTWSASAQKALAAIESHARDFGSHARRIRPRLIHVSPLPPARSGIADYSARLLRELAVHYDIDVVVDQPEVSDSWIQANFPIRSLDWFIENAAGCERILYHFGNSPFHAHMFGMLERHPGVVMLHDSWLGAARNWMANEAGDDESFLRLLYDSHGYAGLLHDLHRGRTSTLDSLPVNRDVIDHSLGVIVHSSFAVAQARRHYGALAAEKFSVVPFPKERKRGDRRLARRVLGIAPGDFVVCSFGMLAPTKLNHRLLAAWLQSPLAADDRCRLIFVGENHGGDYGEAMDAAIAKAVGRERILITGFVDTSTYADYLDATDVAVQLRTESRGETSAAVFDALAHDLPLIVNAHGTAAELAGTAALQLPDHFADAELALTLQSLREDERARVSLGMAAGQLVRSGHHPADVAVRYRDAIEHFVEHSAAAEQQRMLRRMQRVHTGLNSDGVALRQLREVFAENTGRPDRSRIFVDVTATASSELHSGIERVVQGVLSALFQLEQGAYRIEPVRMEGGRYLHAAAYALRLLGHPPLALPETAVQPRPGDILLGLDWVADALPANTALLDAWRVRGVRMIFVVYDLLPVRFPNWFPDGIAAMHASWLQCIGHYADALLCISRFVADDVRRWFDQHPPLRHEPLSLGYFYPGSDPAATQPSTGMPVEAGELLRRLQQAPTFLMVGTVEPRKGHALVLEALERLWADGTEANLVVVGRQGWMSEQLATRLRAHVQTGTQLWWLEGASDEYLEQIYDVSRALVAASEAEGFGLPLVEAARRGLPVIARDIPVFREVSSAFASYFDGSDVKYLVEALRHAASCARPQLPPESRCGPSWLETTGQLWKMLADEQHAQWLPSWRPADQLPVDRPHGNAT